jgi:hypothetical protein
MKAEVARKRTLGSSPFARVVWQEREYIFLALAVLLAISLCNLFIGRDTLRYYKYLSWGTFGLGLLVAGFMSCVRQSPTCGILIAIGFGFIGAVTVVLGQYSTGNSFGSALIPFLVCVLGYLTIGKGVREVQRYVVLTYTACGMILLAGLARSEEFFRVNEFSFVLVFGLAFSLLLRTYFITVSIATALLIVLALRPSSTLFLGAVTGTTLAMISGSRPYLAAIISCCVIIACSTFALVAMSDPDLAVTLGDLESYLKESILGGESNSESRTALIRAIQEEFSNQSLLFGGFFMVSTSPDVSDLLGREEFIAPVHSDFIQMLHQGGLVGLAAFAYFMIELNFLHKMPEPSPEREFLSRAIPVCTAVFAVYISFNPIMMNVEYSIWLFMLSFIALGLKPMPDCRGRRIA